MQDTKGTVQVGAPLKVQQDPCVLNLQKDPNRQRYGAKNTRTETNKTRKPLFPKSVYKKVTF